MRKRYRVLVLAAIVAALIVPFGFAFSVESHAPEPPAATVIAASTVSAPLTLGRTPRAVPEVPDTLKLLLIGTGLFGLAAAVRRAA